jgi:hypothetical protein
MPCKNYCDRILTFNGSEEFSLLQWKAYFLLCKSAAIKSYDFTISSLINTWAA